MTILKLWRHLSPRRRRQLLFLQILSLTSAIAEVGNLGLLFPFLKILANPYQALENLPWGKTWIQTLSDSSLILLLGSVFLVAIVASGFLRVMAIRSQFRLTAGIASDLATQAFRILLYRPYIWHVCHNSSETIGHLTEDLDKTTGLIQSVIGLNISIIIVFGLIIGLLWVSPILTLVTVVILSLVYIIIYQLTRSKLYGHGIQRAENYQRSVKILQESIGGIRDILLDSSQDLFLKAYNQSSRTMRYAGASIGIKAQSPRLLIESIIMFLIIGFVLLLSLLGKNIGQQLPQLGALGLGIYKMLQPLQQCFVSVATTKSSQASLERLLAFMGTSESVVTNIKEITESKSLPLYQALVLKNVGFRYEHEGNWVVDNLNLEILAGSCVGFVGQTGSGKSTTLDILMGLLRPQKGCLLVDGHNLLESNDMLQSWQSSIAHVPQHIYLSDASFAENIAFGVSPTRIDMERVRHVAQIAQISDFIEKRPQGYNELVGERGIKISGGQRQRLGIARALYKRASILFLDEATSALDNKTERQVIDALLEMNHGLTIVMIAHRLSTVQNCNKIYEFMGGKILNVGSYEELLSTSGTFRHLASL